MAIKTGGPKTGFRIPTPEPRPKPKPEQETTDVPNDGNVPVIGNKKRKFVLFAHLTDVGGIKALNCIRVKNQPKQVLTERELYDLCLGCGARGTQNKPKEFECPQIVHNAELDGNNVLCVNMFRTRTTAANGESRFTLASCMDKHDRQQQQTV